MPKAKLLVLLTIYTFISSILSVSVHASEKQTEQFESPIRIGYVPHPSFMVDNGIAAGTLANVFECSTQYFTRIEYVEMSDYSRLLQSLETNVVDIALNVAKTSNRDKVADYAMNLYTSQILLVGNDKSSNNKGAGVLATKRGSEIDQLLMAKGYMVNTQAYSIERLAEMYRKGLINSFAETEVALYGELLAMDADGIDYDYISLAEYSGGAYLSRTFVKNHPKAVEAWRKTSDSCAYLTPKLDP